MTGGRALRALRWGGLLPLGFAAGLGALALACSGDKRLGLPEAFLVFEPVVQEDKGPEPGAGQGQGAVRTASGLPVLSPVAPDDPRAAPLHKELAVGFAGEVLRTDYLAKQLVRDMSVSGRRYDAGARAAAEEPTVFVVGAGGAERLGQGLGQKGAFGRKQERPDVLWIGLDLYPHHDRALPQTLAGLLGTAAASRVAGGPARARHPLVRGYAMALEVIAREWRVGEGPAGALPGDAGTAAQRDLFAAVRQNRFAMDGEGRLRAAKELLEDPGIAATVLYRLAQSKTVGRKIAPPEVYAPFVTDRIPSGVSPAAVLGPFRNFQAKLLSAWGRAVLEGRPPRDIADLVDAYGRALPAERSEVSRLFVMTTFGATVRRGGVGDAAKDAGKALPELTALAAELAAGRVSARAALGE